MPDADPKLPSSLSTASNIPNGNAIEALEQRLAHAFQPIEPRPVFVADLKEQLRRATESSQASRPSWWRTGGALLFFGVLYMALRKMGRIFFPVPTPRRPLPGTMSAAKAGR